MLRSFVLALLKSLLHGPLIALIAFPAAIIASAPAILLFLTLPLLIFVPFLLSIVVFLISHVVWILSARLAGSLVGLGAHARGSFSFMDGFWRALPWAAALSLLAWLIGWSTPIILAELQATLAAEKFATLSTALEFISPAMSGLFTLIMVLLMVPMANGIELRHADAYSTSKLLLRLFVGLPFATALAYVAAQPLALFIGYAMQSDVIQQMTDGDLGNLLQIISFPAFYGGILIWLSAAVLLSLEAGFLARLEGGALVDRFSSPDPEEKKTDYRALRQEWSARSSNRSD